LVSAPHGGRLIDRVVRGPRAERLAEEARSMLIIDLNANTAYEVANLAHGVYSPLEGFMTTMRASSGRQGLSTTCPGPYR